MGPIDGLDTLTRLLRARVANRAGEVRQPTAAKPPATARPRQPPPGLEPALRAKIRQLQQLNRGPDAIEQAVISTLLARELNDRLYNEPKFNALVRQVQRHIGNDPALEAAFRQVIGQLSR